MLLSLVLGMVGRLDFWFFELGVLLIVRFYVLRIYLLLEDCEPSGITKKQTQNQYTKLFII